MILVIAKFYNFYRFLILVVAVILLTCVVLFSPMNISMVLLSLFLSAIYKVVLLVYVFTIFICLYVIFFLYTYAPH
jgi:hypothetical protein